MHSNTLVRAGVYNTSHPEGRTLPSTRQQTSASPIVVTAWGKQPTDTQKRYTAVLKMGSTAQRVSVRRLQPPHQFRLHPFTSKRFHALLNSLFKVLFNFPSRYLFAIGLVLYVALDGVYHPISAAFPNNATLE
jgi:hypothetical protein